MQHRAQPLRNGLLAELAEQDRPHILPHLEIVNLPRGILVEVGQEITHTYFPIDCIIALTVTMRDGGTAETATVGREGMDGYILDLTTLPGRHDVARALLREAVRRFRRAGVQILRYRFLDAPTAPRSEDLWKLGFFPRDNRRNTLLVKFADPDLQGAAKDIDNWTYCVGDGESTFWVR